MENEQILITYNDGTQFGRFGLFINSTDFRKSINEKSEKTELIRQKRGGGKKKREKSSQSIPLFSTED